MPQTRLGRPSLTHCPDGRFAALRGATAGRPPRVRSALARCSAARRDRRARSRPRRAVNIAADAQSPRSTQTIVQAGRTAAQAGSYSLQGAACSTAASTRRMRLSWCRGLAGRLTVGAKSAMTSSEEEREEARRTRRRRTRRRRTRRRRRRRTRRPENEGEQEEASLGRPEDEDEEVGQGGRQRRRREGGRGNANKKYADEEPG